MLSPYYNPYRGVRMTWSTFSDSQERAGVDFRSLGLPESAAPERELSIQEFFDEVDRRLRRKEETLLGKEVSDGR